MFYLPSFPCWWAVTDLSFWLYFSTEKWKKDHPESNYFHVLENAWKHWQIKGSCQEHIWGALYSERKPFWWLKEDRRSQEPDRTSGKALPLPPKLVTLYFPVVIWVWFKTIILSNLCGNPCVAQFILENQIFPAAGAAAGLQHGIGETIIALGMTFVLFVSYLYRWVTWKFSARLWMSCSASYKNWGIPQVPTKEKEASFRGCANANAILPSSVLSYCAQLWASCDKNFFISIFLLIFYTFIY